MAHPGRRLPAPLERIAMIKGFKEFIAQGNALELAVAVIIGGAFKPIVDSITKVIMTIIGQLIGQPNFDSLGAFSLYQDGKYTFHLATAKELAANPDGFVMPGEIVTTIINFILIAIAVYHYVKIGDFVNIKVIEATDF